MKISKIILIQIYIDQIVANSGFVHKEIDEMFLGFNGVFELWKGLYSLTKMKSAKGELMRVVSTMSEAQSRNVLVKILSQNIIAE